MTAALQSRASGALPSGDSRVVDGIEGVMLAPSWVCRVPLPPVVVCDGKIGRRERHCGARFFAPLKPRPIDIV
jgi:hypothetical protein